MTHPETKKSNDSNSGKPTKDNTNTANDPEVIPEDVIDLDDNDQSSNPYDNEEQLQQHLLQQQQLINQQHTNGNTSSNPDAQNNTTGNHTRVSQNQMNKPLQDKGNVDSNQKIDLKKLMMVSMKNEMGNEKDFQKRSLEQKFGHTPPVQGGPGGKCLDLNVALPELKKNFEYDDNKFFDNFEQKFTDLIEDKHDNLFFPNLKLTKQEFQFINTLEDRKK